MPQLRGTEFDDDGLKVPTLEEIIDLVKQVEADTGRQIGIYPETKHPTYFAESGTMLDGTPININLGQQLIDTLVENDFTDPDRVFIQSFEVGNLQELQNEIMPEAGIDLPLVQLIGGSGAPYDFTESGDPRTYTDLTTPEGLDFINDYAEGIGPDKRLIVPAETVDLDGDGEPDDLNNDGTISDGDRVLAQATDLVEDAHAADLLVHPYTFRIEDFYLGSDYNGDPEAEFEQFIELGVDGFFTDFPGTAEEVLDLAIAVPNLLSSRGFEGMAFSPDRSTLYPMLEGAVTGDPDISRRIYKFDVSSTEFTGLVGYYPVADPDNAIGDFTPINENEFLVIERDNEQAEAAEFKKIFKIDISQVDKDGYVAKEEVVDLLNIQDPNDLNGDGETTFDFPFVTIEDVLVIDENTILVANDNNYPFSVGRSPGIDNSEIILLELDESLDLDPRLGGTAITSNKDSSPTLDFGTIKNDTLAVNDSNKLVFAGAGDDQIDATNSGGSNRIFSSVGDDTFILSSGDQLNGGDGNDRFFVQSGGDNRITGGAGADSFWIAVAELPETTNTITDFKPGVDLLGIEGLGLGFDELSLTQTRADTIIAALGQDLAILRGIENSSLSSADFVFA